MASSNSDDEIRRSRKNRDKARNEQQKNVLLTELVKMHGDKCGELSRHSSELQGDSDALIQRSKQLRETPRVVINTDFNGSCEERTRLLEVLVERTTEYAKAAQAERDATDHQHSQRLRDLTNKARQQVQIARRELAEHKRNHGCARAVQI